MQQFGNVEIKGRHVDVTDAIKNYALDKISKIERFSPRMIEVMVTLDIQKQDQIVDIVMRFDSLRLKVEAISDNLYASIDKAVEKLVIQVRKYKDRMADHHQRSLSDIEMNVDVLRLPEEDLKALNEDIEEENVKSEVERYRPHHVVSREKRRLKTLTKFEAILKMEISAEHFMVYRSEEDRKLKIIYRRDDGNYAIIEPEA
jgi:putative sigma-54 modulation protein